MRRLLYTALGAAALASASIANAAVTVTSSTNLTDPNPCCGPAPGNTSIATQDGTTTIAFGLNPTGTSFTSTFTFMNDVAGLYNFLVGTSTDGLMFTNVSVTGGGTTSTFAPPPASVIQRFGISMLANTAYTVNITGTSPVAAGALSGNVTIRAVPEPAAWAMMIVGFGAMGLVLRRRRRPTLAQIA